MERKTCLTRSQVVFLTHAGISFHTQVPWLQTEDDVMTSKRTKDKETIVHRYEKW